MKVGIVFWTGSVKSVSGSSEEIKTLYIFVSARRLIARHF